MSALVATPAPSTAQGVTVGTGVDYLGYSFDDGLGAEAAQLLMVPVAMRVPVGESLSFDLFSAWADGRVEQGGRTLTLSGPIDTEGLLAGHALGDGGGERQRPHGGRHP